MLALNPDATIDADSVRVLLAASRADPRALIGPRSRPERRDDLVLGRRAGPTRTGPRDGRAPTELDGDRTWQTGACFLATIAMWDEVGGFDDDYFMYWEDIDLSWRWRDAGGTLILLADATAVHDAGGTQAGAGKSPLYVYFNCRNRLLFARKRFVVQVRPAVVAGQHRLRVERRHARQPAGAGAASAAALVGSPGNARRRVRPIRSPAWERAHVAGHDRRRPGA